MRLILDFQDGALFDLAMRITRIPPITRSREMGTMRQLTVTALAALK